mmetsp:Transcript_50643/g.158234  ORF Transcript_50643/g.158234 Transcript_50643/m.158234 type:complete len:242 (+) Transcript_50643:154-879(+)
MRSSPRPSNLHLRDAVGSVVGASKLIPYVHLMIEMLTDFRVKLEPLQTTSGAHDLLGPCAGEGTRRSLGLILDVLLQDVAAGGDEHGSSELGDAEPPLLGYPNLLHPLSFFPLAGNFLGRRGGGEIEEKTQAVLGQVEPEGTSRWSHGAHGDGEEGRDNLAEDRKQLLLHLGSRGDHQHFLDDELCEMDIKHFVLLRLLQRLHGGSLQLSLRRKQEGFDARACSQPESNLLFLGDRLGEVK